MSTKVEKHLSFMLYFFLLRFGKRAPMRFGKRAPMRFGKRDELDDLNEMYEFLPAHNELSYPYEQ